MFFEMRSDLGTLDSGERSLPFGLLVFADYLLHVSVLATGIVLCVSIIEPRHNKTNKMSVFPVKTQVSLGICPV